MGEPEPVEVPLKKPAILAGEGTSAVATFCERPKPQPKVSYLKSIRRRNARLAALERAEKAASVQSSLMSGDIALPGEAVYSQYDDAIDRLDEDDDVETAVNFAEKSQKSREESVKSVQDLLDEAKRISSAGSQPLYKEGLPDDSKLK